METVKRLYRSETDKMLGGVCGGIAEYLMIDSSIVRILFVLFSLMGGSGVLLYFVLWLIIPTKSSSGVVSDATMKQNTKDMENVARKVVDTVEEKVNASRKSAVKPKKTTTRAKTKKSTVKRTTKASKK